MVTPEGSSIRGFLWVGGLFFSFFFFFERNMFYKKQELITTCCGGHLILVTPHIHSLSFSCAHKLSFSLSPAPTALLWFFSTAHKNRHRGDFWDAGCFQKVPLQPRRQKKKKKSVLGPFGLGDHGAAVPRRLHPNYSLIIFHVLKPKSVSPGAVSRLESVPVAPVKSCGQNMFGVFVSSLHPLVWLQHFDANSRQKQRESKHAHTQNHHN